MVLMVGFVRGIAGHGLESRQCEDGSMARLCAASTAFHNGGNKSSPYAGQRTDILGFE